MIRLPYTIARPSRCCCSFRLPYSRRGISSRGPLPTVPLWLNGQPEASSSTQSYFVRNSKSRKESCEVIAAGEAETTEAIRASRRAFESWRATSGWHRRKILGKVLALLEAKSGALTEAIRADAAFSDIVIGNDQKTAAGIVDGAGITAVSLDGCVPTTADSTTTLVLREPYGPILSIPAFNFPLTLALRSIVYPIACGNTVIMKSSKHIPQLHHALGPLFAEAGLPPGVLQILNFREDEVADRVEQMISDPDIRMMNLTGSTSLGRKLAQLCGRYLKPSLMELGAKSPALVLPGADLRIAANNVLFGSMVNSGQICMSTERVIVDQTLIKDFEQALVQASAELQSRSFELVRETGVEDLNTLVQDAVDTGARHVLPSPTQTATSSTPIVLSDISPSSSIYTEESFAPLLTLIPAESTAHAIEIANSHPAGLSSSIFTSDLALALKTAKKLEVGAVHINGITVHDEHALPFGGVKDSGWGRFNGRGAIEAFTWTKNIRLGDGHTGLLPLQAL